jgi:hypothetical protein
MGDGDGETRGGGDKGTGDTGDGETRGRGDFAWSLELGWKLPTCGEQPRVAVSPLLRVGFSSA